MVGGGGDGFTEGGGLLWTAGFAPVVGLGLGPAGGFPVMGGLPAAGGGFVSFPRASVLVLRKCGGLLADMKLAAGSRKPPATTPEGTPPAGGFSFLDDEPGSSPSWRFEGLRTGGAFAGCGGMLFIDLRCWSLASSILPV